MREIKFRAWDEQNKTWYFPTNINIELDGTVILIDHERAKGFQRQIRYDITLQQYTGLKDKNGKEIYEGDIVKHDFYNYLFTVKYDHSCFVITTGAMNKHHLCEDNTEKKIEVIGNIYENPELLTPTQ